MQGLKVPCSGVGKWGYYKKGSIKRHANATKVDEPLQKLGLQMIPNPELCVQVVVGFPLEANQA